MIPEATTVSGSHVFIDENASLPPKEIAGHEAFHFWRKSGAAEDYKDTVLEELRFTSPAFREFQSTIAKRYFGTEVDLTDERKWNRLLDEILAYIGGKIHEGSRDDELRPMFRDYDAVVRAWQRLVRQMTGGYRDAMNPSR